uniref:C2 domain-containing protein n=1 Tax=Strigamia maritima TaxID=126957 RepID=T1J7P2_STRMM
MVGNERAAHPLVRYSLEAGKTERQKDRNAEMRLSKQAGAEDRKEKTVLANGVFTFVLGAKMCDYGDDDDDDDDGDGDDGPLKKGHGTANDTRHDSNATTSEMHDTEAPFRNIFLLDAVHNLSSGRGMGWDGDVDVDVDGWMERERHEVGMGRVLECTTPGLNVVQTSENESESESESVVNDEGEARNLDRTKRIKYASSIMTSFDCTCNRSTFLTGEKCDEKRKNSKSKEKNMLSDTTTALVVAGSIVAFVLVFVVILCVCWRWRRPKRDPLAFMEHRKKRKMDLTSNEVPKKVSQAGVTSEPIPFVLPSINLQSGDESESGRENGRIAVIRYAQTDTWLGLPTGNIDRDMYVSSEGDEATTPSVTGLGKIGLSIRYDIVHELLKVRLVGATNLKAKFRKNAADPHVKLTILPENSPKFFSNVHRNTLNPMFDEEFAFQVPLENAQEKTLKIAVCDLDRFSRRVIIGYVMLPLPEIGIKKNIASSVCTGDIWRDLYDSYDKHQSSEGTKGDIFLSLSYNPDAGVLVVGVHKAKNIRTTKDKDISAIYSKVTLFVCGKYVKSKKTSAKKKTLEPEFDESFAIQLPRDRLQAFHVIVALCARNRLGGRFVLGRTQIGAFAYVSGPGLDHWLDAINSPKSIVAQWHTLS